MTNTMQNKNIDIAKQLDDTTKEINVESKSENIKNQQLDSIMNAGKVNNYPPSGSTSSGSDFQS